MDLQKELGVLWKKQSRKGHEYFSGKINIDGKTVEIVIFYITKRKASSPHLKIIQSHFLYEGDKE